MCADDGWSRLGFTGKPTYELLREFVNERIGDDRFRLLFDTLLVELCRLEKTPGVSIGRRVGNDGTDGHSLKHDSEAKYSGYCKHNGCNTPPPILKSTNTSAEREAERRKGSSA